MGVWGGGERQFYEISKRAAIHGNEVCILTCRFPGQPSEEIIDGVQVYRYGLSRNPLTGGARKAILPVFSYILKTGIEALKLEPDLIHCNTYFPVYCGVIASRFRGTPLISTFHDIYSLRGWINSQKSVFLGVLGHFATTVAAKLPFDRIIAVSPQCKTKLQKLGIPEKKITVVPNGVDLELFRSINVNKIDRQVLYVGRLVNFKHVDWLIEAFAKVLKKVPAAKLKIVGSGPEWSNLNKLVKELHLQSFVTFTGKTATYDSVARYFKESEIFVLPSIVEGEAIVLKEAMGAGLPSLAMNVPGSGVLSIVRNGKNGFLIAPGRPDLIAEKIIELLEDENKRKEMGYAGMKSVEGCDWNVIAERTMNVYREVLSSDRP